MGGERYIETQRSSVKALSNYISIYLPIRLLESIASQRGRTEKGAKLQRKFQECFSEYMQNRDLF